MLIYILGAFLTPIIGYFIDKFGKKRKSKLILDKIILLTCLLFIMTHLFLFLLEKENQTLSIIGIVLYGICNSLYSTSIISSIPYSI